MKTTSTTLVLLVILIVSAPGCTIEKRLFQPGYSIEWKKKIPKKDEAETLNRIAESGQDTSIISNPAVENKLDRETESPSTKHITDPESGENILKPLTPAKPHAIPLAVEPANRKMTSSIHQKAGNSSWETEERKEFELFGVMSFGLYFSSLALTIIGIVLLSSPYFFVAAGFMILLALIFGIISVDKYRRDKSRYRRNFFGYFGMIASIATITFTIGLVLLAWGVGSF